MSANIALFQAMLREQIEPKIQDQTDWIDPLLEDILNYNGANRDGIEVDMKNNKFDIVSQIGRMTGYAGAEWAALISSDVALEKMYINSKYVTASFRIWGEAIKATTKDQASLETGTSLYGIAIRKAMLDTKGRFLRWNGTGIVWILPIGVQTGTAVTVDAKARGLVASENRYWLGALQIFQPWQEISFGTEAAFAAWTQIDAVVSTVDSDTQITLTASKTVWTTATGNNRAGTNADSWHIRLKWEYGNSPMGIFGLVDDWTQETWITTIQSLTRASTPYMKSYVLDKANSNTIIKDFRDTYSAFTRFNKSPKYWLVSEDVYASYTDAITITVTANQHQTPYTSKLGVWHSWLEFAYGGKPIPILMDTLLPYGKALLLDTDQLFCADMYKDDFVEDWIMTRIPWYNIYETVRAASFNFGTYSSRKLWALINYQA